MMKLTNRQRISSQVNPEVAAPVNPDLALGLFSRVLSLLVGALR
jgi:hypothetical protein